MKVTVEPEGLSADGMALGTWSTAGPAPVVVPPGADSVSMHLAAHLSVRSQLLSVLLEHAEVLREIGGVATQHSAEALRSTDKGNAGTIAGGVQSSGRDPGVVYVSRVAPPVVPDLPVMPAPEVVPGEVLAAQLFDGPGSGSMRDLADMWRTRAAELDHLAGDLRGVAASIDDHWDDDGLQQAGRNVFQHADWVSGMAGQARELAAAAEQSADRHDEARASTPTPQDFAAVHDRLNKALADNAASGGLQIGRVVSAVRELSDRQASAVDAGGHYYSAALTTTGGASAPPKPAPPIAGGGPDALPITRTGDPPQHQSPQGDDGDHHKHAADGDAPSDGPGHGVTTGDHQPSTGPPHPQDTPPSPAAAPVAPLDSTTPGVAANVAGTVMGAGVGALSQLANGSPLRALGAPLQALSALSGLPSMGAPSMPHMPSDPGVGGMEPGTGLGDGPGDYGTSPASDFGSGGGGDAGSVPPVSSPAPATGAPAVQGGPPALAGGAPASGAPIGGGAGGMLPPLLGGLGGTNEGHRNTKLSPDQRVVLRRVPNTEPVFGELERTRRPRAARLAQEAGDER